MSKNNSTDTGILSYTPCPMQKLNKEEISDIAETLAISFKGYTLFEYFSNRKYSISKMKQFWKVNLSAMSDHAQIISIRENLSAIAILVPNEQSSFKIGKYIKSGLLGTILKFGPISSIKMMRFENFAETIKNKYASSDCWYFYALVTRPEFRGLGLGSKIMHSLMDFLDENQQSCYLETMSPVNVDIYTHYGFELKETVSVPNTDMTLYAMLRSPKKPESDAK